MTLADLPGMGISDFGHLFNHKKSINFHLILLYINFFTNCFMFIILNFFTNCFLFIILNFSELLRILRNKTPYFLFVVCLLIFYCCVNTKLDLTIMLQYLKLKIFILIMKIGDGNLKFFFLKNIFETLSS